MVLVFDLPLLNFDIALAIAKQARPSLLMDDSVANLEVGCEEGSEVGWEVGWKVAITACTFVTVKQKKMRMTAVIEMPSQCRTIP
jgi:hypothetical protein